MLHVWNNSHCEDANLLFVSIPWLKSEGGGGRPALCCINGIIHTVKRHTH